jgi:hypothetical protein
VIVGTVRGTRRETISASMLSPKEMVNEKTIRARNPAQTGRVGGEVGAVVAVTSALGTRDLRGPEP